MIEIRTSFAVEPSALLGLPSEQLSALLNRVMEALAVSPVVADCAIEADWTLGTVCVSVTLSGTQLEQATARGVALIRGALAVAESATAPLSAVLIETEHRSQLVA